MRTSRLSRSYQCSCQNSEPPTSLPKTKPLAPPAGAGVTALTGSRWKVSCSRMPKGALTRWTWAVSPKRVVISRLPSCNQPASEAPRVYWSCSSLSISSGGTAGRFSMTRLPSSILSTATAGIAGSSASPSTSASTIGLIAPSTFASEGRRIPRFVARIAGLPWPGRPPRRLSGQVQFAELGLLGLGQARHADLAHARIDLVEALLPRLPVQLRQRIEQLRPPAGFIAREILHGQLLQRCLLLASGEMLQHGAGTDARPAARQRQDLHEQRNARLPQHREQVGRLDRLGQRRLLQQQRDGRAHQAALGRGAAAAARRCLRRRAGARWHRRAGADAGQLRQA